MEEGPSALHFAEFIAASACFVWEDTRVRLRLLSSSLDRQPVARPSALRGMLKVWSSAGRFFREARLRMEGKLPPWSRTIWPRICPGSSLDPSSITGALPDRRPSKGM